MTIPSGRGVPGAVTGPVPEPAAARRQRFVGWITGVGTSTGPRIVVGLWQHTPWGPFADVMVERPDGSRLLCAPDERARDFVAATYHFDELRIAPVRVVAARRRLSVRTEGLQLDLALGDRTGLGQLLALVPSGLAVAPAWLRLIDPVARRVLPGVGTAGTAGSGRREYYGATDQHAVASLRGRLDGVDLGVLAPVDPPVRFGFSSTPRRPGIVAVTTTIDLPAG